MKEIYKQELVIKPQSWWQVLLRLLLVSTGFFYNGYVLAAGAQQVSTNLTLGSIASQVTTSFGALAQLITAGSYVAGMGFALAAILKFKQHKDNPTQITIGAPIALLFIAAALIFLPNIFGIAGVTIFGSGASYGGVTGVSTF